MKKIFSLFFITLFLCNLICAQDFPMQITEKPIPATKDKDNFPHAQGVVRVRVEFLASGEIGKVSLVSGLSGTLSEDALEAAKKIKFEPAIKNGNSVSTIKQVEYNFLYGWTKSSLTDEKAEAIIKRAVEKLGGQNYLQAKSIAASGNFTLFIDGQAQMPSSFVDVLVFPDKERTEFRQSGVKNVQTNTGSSGWLFDGAAGVIKEQSKKQIEEFRRGLQTSLDNLLRGGWRAEGAALSYAGRRQAGVGRRNDVVKLAYADGCVVEFEFADDGLPVKSVYTRKNSEGEETKEEDRYAQFIDVGGIYAPFIVDHFTNGKQTSRVNYLNIQFNKSFPDSLFAKPSNARALKKDLKL